MVLHSWWGLNHNFRDYCSRLAAEGFFVVAPDLYDGQVAHSIDEAKKLRAQTSASRKQPVYKTLINVLNESVHSEFSTATTISLIGFSMGGHWALWLSQRPELPIAKTVIYYAARNGHYDQSRSSFLFHLAQDDEWVSAASLKKLQRSLESAGRAATFHTYAGTEHWFAENGPETTYKPRAASLSWRRTLEFLRT